VTQGDVRRVRAILRAAPPWRTINVVPEERTQRTLTREEVEREERAQRARVRRDAARGVSRNLEAAVAHAEFARRFAEAFRRDQKA